MSLHQKPVYNHERLREALKEHGMVVDEPSQISDAFRLGWAAALRAVREQEKV